MRSRGVRMLHGHGEQSVSLPSYSYIHSRLGTGSGKRPLRAGPRSDVGWQVCVAYPCALTLCGELFVVPVLERFSVSSVSSCVSYSVTRMWWPKHCRQCDVCVRITRR